MKLGMYIMAPDPISTKNFINSFHEFLCLHVYVARQRIGVNVTAATNTHATIEELLDAFFYATRIVSKESRRFILPKASFRSLLCDAVNLSYKV
jgi:hypothetical protein